MTGMRISVLGSSRACDHLRSVLATEGITADYVGEPPREERSADQVAEWIKMYLIEDAVDASIGRPVSTTMRAAVDKVIAEFKKRYPNIRITIDE